jgi:hypothetical protein
MPGPVRLEDELRHLALFGPAGGDALGALRAAAVQEHHNLLSQSARFYLEREEAEALITAMEQRIAATSYETARREGVSEQDCGRISTAFVYSGFRLKLEDRQE